MLTVGQKIIKIEGPITREMIKEYADASGDQNPIHINDEFATKVGLKGVIAHGMLSFGFCNHHVSDLAFENNAKIMKIGCEMRGMVRPGDTIITNIEIKSIQDKKIELEIIQNSKMPLHLEKNGQIIKVYEAEEKDWVQEKEREGIKTETTPDGNFTYREWLVNKGWATIKQN
jgi:acyl dehydratase